jgi:serum/glucocorticoid-regulated kinase 2
MTASKKDQSNSFCGTPEYLSPEMIIGNGHDHTVDWWTVGILLYELIVGITPFFHRNQHRMQYLIQECPVAFPDSSKFGIEVSPVARDIIKQLLEKDKTKRLGAAGDMTEILQHPFFASLNIEKLLKKELVPPYKPVINDDLKFFDSSLTGMKNIQESVIDKSRQKFILENQHVFQKF